MAFKRVPLALLNLIENKRRLVLAVAGIGFAVLLMCMQIGFYNGMLDSTVQLLRQLDADLIIISRARYSTGILEKFPRQRLAQVRAVAGVKRAEPFYVYWGDWKKTEGEHTAVRQELSVRVLAFDPDFSALKLPGVTERLNELKRPGAVLVDLKAKEDYSFEPGLVGELAELSGRRVRVVGTFELGTDFATDATLITAATSLPGLFGHPLQSSPPQQEVDFGLVQMSQGENLQQAKQAVAAVLPEDVKVLTRAELVRQEMEFWKSSTPVGYVFWLGTVMGFVVGTIICNQILHADVDDHMAEFATLKAMGYSNRYFAWVVFQEAIILSVLGFLPGVIVSLVLYHLLGSWTGLVMQLTLWRAGLVLVLTVGMCLLSGFFAIRKLLRVDPAELF